MNYPRLMFSSNLTPMYRANSNMQSTGDNVNTSANKEIGLAD